MAVVSSARPHRSDQSSHDFKSKASSVRSGQAAPIAGPSKPKPSTAPRPAPSFLSSLKDDEADFPRGGGSSLTPIEVKQIRAEGRREADAENEAEANATGGKRTKKPMSERETKRLKKNLVVKPSNERDKDKIRVEELNYKRLTTGTRLLTRIHTILPLHLILSLPNHLLAHVPITEISNTLTTLLSTEEDTKSTSEAGSDSDDTVAAPDLGTLFIPGQYVTAKVLTVYPTASQSFISQYPVTETTRLAARLEMTLVPEKVNSEIATAELGKGYLMIGEVRSEEDKGWRIGLGLNKDEDTANAEGWINKAEAERSKSDISLVPGQLVGVTVSSLSAGGRVVNLSVDPQTIIRSQLAEASTVASILPGHLVSVLITAVVPSGLNVKICGFFDGTIDLAHLGLGDADIEQTYKVGQKVRARIIYESLATTPRHFALSVLPHILSRSSSAMPDKVTSVEQAVPIGKLFSNVTVSRVIPEWGLVCRTEDGLEGFVHISHISNDRISTLSSGISEYKAGTLHRARVIGHSPFDGVLILSFEQKVLDQAFMQVDELEIGQVMRGTIHRLTDKALFINLHGSVHGVVWPLHFADIRLKHPEKRFKVGATVRCRIFALESARGRVVLTLKKTLVDSTLDVPKTFADVVGGQIMPAVVSKLLDKGCIVDLFGGMRAFVPQSEASQNFITNLSDIFFVGKSLDVRITSIDPDSGKIVASVRQALPTALAAANLEVGQTVGGIISQIHPEQVVINLVPYQTTALLSLSNLSNHRQMSVEDLRSTLTTGEMLDDLIVVSKNSTSGLLIVANKRSSKTPSGVSRSAESIDNMEVGVITPGHVLSHTPGGAMIQLGSGTRGRVHPCDAADDFSAIASGAGPLNVDDDVMCYVLKTNTSTRIIDLSTRPSRIQPDKASEVVDKEIQEIADLREGQPIRGLVKNLSQHGVFVALGRTVTARIMIKEMFDDFVKDWQSRFETNQLVSGTILSIDTRRKLVEMTLRKNPTAKASKATDTKRLNDYEEGQKVAATVRKVETYGMFLHIDGSNISGLCHRSEISDDKKQNVSQALKGFREGDHVKAAIVSIDREKERVNFGIKASYFKDDFADEDGLSNGISTGGGVNAEEMEDKDVAEAESNEKEGSEDGSDDVDGGNLNDGDLDETESAVEDAESEEREGGTESEQDDGVHLDAISLPKGGASKVFTPKNHLPTSSRGLVVDGGFDWSANAPANMAEPSGSSSDEEDDVPIAPIRSVKAEGKRRAVEDLTATAPDARPESVTDFERALLASPNSSFLWIQYMSFQLQLHEIDKARLTGRQALGKIGFREEEEKLNVWMALINLELGFGTEDSAQKVFEEAAEYNDTRTIHLRYADALQEAGKEEAVEDMYKRIVKKFPAHPESWTRSADFYLKKGDVDSARDLLPRSLLSLDKTKHVETIEKMAVLEFKHGDSERGKTLFEGLVYRFPRRLDLWSVYIDQLAKSGEIQGVRGLFDRILTQKLTSKKAKFLFKKWLAVETRLGDTKGQEKAKQRAREWVTANVKSTEDGDEER